MFILYINYSLKCVQRSLQKNTGLWCGACLSFALILVAYKKGDLIEARGFINEIR